MKRRLSRNVYVLSAVSFFQDAASELVYPVLPLFITGTLGASAAVVGLIEGVAEATASFAKVISGRLADKRSRKPLIGTGYGISSASKVAIGFAWAWPMVLVARFLDRVGKGIRTSPRDALIAGDTPVELRGRAFGLHRAADTMGAVVGPLLGLLMYEVLNHKLRPLFLVAAIPAALSVALVGLVRETPKTVEAVTADDPPVSAPSRPLPRSYWRVVTALTVFGLANFSDAFIILRAKALGMGFVSIVLVYALYNLSYAALAYPFGKLSDRIPRHRVFAMGLAAFSVAYIGLGVTRASVWVWLLLPVYGVYTAATDGVSRAWVADLLPADRLGTGLGMYQGLAGGASLIAGIWAGLLWGEGGALPLIASGLVVAILTPVIWSRAFGPTTMSVQKA